MKVDRQDVDCEARSGDQVLPIQVTRVSASRFWKKLGRVGKVTEQGTADQAADELMNAIAAKARRLPAVQKAKLVLALTRETRRSSRFAVWSAGSVSGTAIRPLLRASEECGLSGPPWISSPG